MDGRSLHHTHRNHFYDYHEEKKGIQILGLILITIGMYIIKWIYEKNKEFEILDPDAPDSQRGAVLVFIMPFIWVSILYVLGYLLDFKDNLLFQIFEILGSLLLYFLILKYLLDFCFTFGRITKTHGFLWFIPVAFGTFGVWGIIFQIYYLMPLSLLIFGWCPGLQIEFNSYIKHHRLRRHKNHYYH